MSRCILMYTIHMCGEIVNKLSTLIITMSLWCATRNKVPVSGRRKKWDSKKISIMMFALYYTYIHYIHTLTTYIYIYNHTLIKRLYRALSHKHNAFCSYFDVHAKFIFTVVCKNALLVQYYYHKKRTKRDLAA